MIPAAQPDKLPPHDLLPALQVDGLTVYLRRSHRRRTLGLQVRDGVATAHAPAYLPLEKIEAFLLSKRHWLSKHLHAQRRSDHGAALQLGDTVLFLGEQLTLRAQAGVTAVRRQHLNLLVPESSWQGPLKGWTQRSVLVPYTQLVTEYAAQLGALEHLREVKVSDTRSRWGSCTAGGVIRLHWALSRAPVAVLRYVALHEAAHLLELNHSARYWRHVARIMPEHALHRDWLRQHGPQLMDDKF